jgi:uncharacterized oligopeptide transporter (OPT) family protein
MVIGIVLSGIVTGLVGAITALISGFSIWAAIALYPVVGTLGAMAFIAYAVIHRDDEPEIDFGDLAISNQ